MFKNILIRCDASKDIGLGHLIRCLELAKQFKKQSFEVFFAIKHNHIIIKKLKENRYKYFLANETNFDYESWLYNLCIENSIDIFIGDVRDGLSIKCIRKLKDKKILTVAVDEPSEYAKECDLCFYPPHSVFDRNKYLGEVFQGFEYTILREEFYEDFEKVKNNKPHLLIMMGGTDTYNYTLPILKRITKINCKFEISVVLNPQHKDYMQVKEIANKSLEKIKVYEKITNMSKFLNMIDFAIITFGTLAYELIYKKIPAIHIYHNPNDRNMSEYFIRNNFALLGDENHIDLDKLTFLSFRLNKKKCKIIETIINYYQKRKIFGY